MYNFDTIISEITSDYYKQLDINGWTPAGVVNTILFLNFINDAWKYSEDIFTDKFKHIINLYLECLRTKSCYINRTLVKD